MSSHLVVRLGVLLQKERVYAEVYNDLDRAVVNFFQVPRDPATRQALIEALVLTPYSRNDFELAWESSADPVEEARRLAIRAQMGFGSAGATKGATGFRIDTKREYGTAQHLWTLYPDAIANAGERLSGVLIENRPAIEVMRAHDGPTTLHFVDPPYMLGTRVLDGGNKYYRHEMNDDDHAELLDALRSLQGMIVLSGYPSDLYNSRLQDWAQYQTKARISAGRGTALRTEVVWINPACSGAIEAQDTQQSLFIEEAA